MTDTPLSDDVVNRFWSFVPDRPDVGCWEWRGVRSSQGYGTMRALGRTLRATHAAVLVTTGKLPEDKVRAIRASPKLINDIAAEYGVCRSTVSKIRTRMYWKHV